MIMVMEIPIPGFRNVTKPGQDKLISWGNGQKYPWGL